MGSDKCWGAHPISNAQPSFFIDDLTASASPAAMSQKATSFWPVFWRFSESLEIQVLAKQNR